MRTLLVLLFSLGLQAAEVELRYIAHAAFLLTSPQGVRVAIDPYNNHVWLRYTYPENIAADAVLVSHPHFDHDAHYYIRGFPAVFRQPGQYALGDVRITGIKGRHADPYGAEFGQLNTIWLVDTGGLRIAHLGDNAPLTPEAAKALGRMDVLLVPIDDTEHILKFSEIDAILAALHPRVIVPMHYRSGPDMGPEDLQDIDGWLKMRAGVRKPGHTVRLSPATLPANPTVFRMSFSADVRPWTAEFREALATVRQFNRILQEKPPPEMLVEWGPRLARATSLDPTFIAGWHARAMLERLQGRADEAIRLLQTGLAASYPDDTERVTLARALLAELLDERGRNSEARVHWLDLLRTSHRADIIEKARRALELK